MESSEIIRKTGPKIAEIIPDLGQLRIQIFKDFPYLYEGSLAYETEYLQIYTQSSESIAVILYHENQAIGATTGMPLKDESSEIQAPFRERNLPISSIFYFGESILLPAFRGKGYGHLFFEEREKHALSLGYTQTAFCSVVRPEDHPLKPEDYRPNDAFWIKRGYTKQSFSCRMKWQDLQQTAETEKELIFWIKKWK